MFRFVIADDEYCNLLFVPGWKTIYVEPNLCNNYNQDLEIIGDSCLEELTIGGNSLTQLYQINIANNPKLKGLVFNSLYTTTWRGAMFNVSGLSIYSE